MRRTCAGTEHRAVTGVSGILLLDKPAGMTSHDVVSRTRRLAATRRVGHAGTLDPMATGLLILGINSSTRLLTFVVGLDKEYLATVRLGASTTTDDREGEVLATAEPGTVDAVSPASVMAGVAALTGDIEQVPSAVSAIKVNGQRAYARVRAGEQVVLDARSVTVSEFEVMDSRRDGAFLDLDVQVSCSSGTYIRALARDLGAALGVGGHLTALRRTRVGPFRVADAATFETVDVDQHLLPPAAVARRLFAVRDVTVQEAVDLGHGKRLRLDDAPDGSPVAAISPEGILVGLLEIFDGQAKPIVNFPADELAAGAVR